MNSDVLEKAYFLINEQTKALDSAGLNGADNVVQILSLSKLRDFHDWLVKRGEIIISGGKLDSRKTSSRLPYSIMKMIAYGGSLGAELENAFPEYQDSNFEHLQGAFSSALATS